MNNYAALKHLNSDLIMRRLVPGEGGFLRYNEIKKAKSKLRVPDFSFQLEEVLVLLRPGEPEAAVSSG